MVLRLSQTTCSKIRHPFTNFTAHLGEGVKGHVFVPDRVCVSPSNMSSSRASSGAYYVITLLTYGAEERRLMNACARPLLRVPAALFSASVSWTVLIY